MPESQYPTQAPLRSDDRIALAPYNFVPLPEQVVPAELPLPRHDVYHAGRHTGRVMCTLTTASPLYVRCGLSAEQLRDGLEAKQLADFFFVLDRSLPVIPGSSLRGMLRALVEIASYGKMEKVTDRPRYFYRAVASRGEDPLAGPYRGQLRSVRAGVVVRGGDGWRICPARAVNGESFIKVRETDIPQGLGLVRLNEAEYHLQVLPVSFTVKRLKPSPRSPQGRTVIDQIDRPGVHAMSGWLVTSGNMLETGDGRKLSPRKNHVVVPAPEEGEGLPIAATAAADYRSGLSTYQVEQLGDSGVLQDGRPVFFCDPARGEREVVAFGHNPNFRLPFRFPGSERAATPRDFVPQDLRDDTMVDLAEAIFGFVRQVRHDGAATQALAGRVSVGDATLEAGQADVWYSDEPITPRILATPKATTFQHYLVQPDARLGALKHYASAPGAETVVRGHKLYWHKGPQPDIRLPAEQQQINDTQKTQIRPVRAGVSFSFTLQFENLSAVELGALLWVLRLAADDRYRVAIGMGKPLGMGAVRIQSGVWLSDRARRYEPLFAGDAWATGEALAPLSEDEQQPLVEAFSSYVLGHSGEQARGYQRLEETLRIRCLLMLLKWEGPPAEQTRYLEIERDRRRGTIPAADVRGSTANEYKSRPVLPTPLQVAGEVPSEPEAPAAEASPRAAEPPAARPAAPQIPEVGAVYRDEIVAADESAVIVKVPGFTIEQAFGRMTDEVLGPRIRNYRVGNQARVEVVSVRQAKSGRYIVDLKPSTQK